MGKITVNYKVNGEAWQKEVDKAFEKLNKKVKIDGFREGKAPRAIFEKKYGRQELYVEASDNLIHKEFHRIIDEKKLEPVVEPKVDLVKVDDEGLEVNYTFITDPEVKLGEYKNLGIKKDKVSVSKKEIEDSMNHLLNDYAELVSVSRKVKKGDTAIISFEGFKDGVAFPGGKGENYSLEIGSNSFIPGFEDGIIGMEKDEEKDLELTFPENYQAEDLKGKKVIFKVKVHDIKERKVPELNKEFFEDLNIPEVNSKESLEEMLKKEIEYRKQTEADNKFIDSLLKKACSNMEASIEDEIYEAEVDRMYNDLMERMKMQGVNEELYFAYTKTTKEDLRKNMMEEAKNRVESRYLLMAIAKAEKIDPKDEEALEELKNLALKYHATEEEIKEAFGSMDAIKFDLKMRKAINILKDNN